jgi:hypothetical protein
MIDGWIEKNVVFCISFQADEKVALKNARVSFFKYEDFQNFM